MMQPRVDQNPYAAPSPGSTQSFYYVTDASQATYREIWRIAAPSYRAFCWIALAKLLRRPLRTTFGMAHGLIRIVELNDVSDRLKQELAGALADCQQHGFTPRFAVTIPVVGDLGGGNIVHVNRDRTVLAMATFARAAERQDVVLTLVSKLDNGRILPTTDSKRRFDPPPDLAVEYRTGASFSELVDCHAARLKEIGKARPLVLDDVSQRQLMLDNAQRTFDYLRQRGLVVPMTDAEVAQARAKTPPSL